MKKILLFLAFGASAIASDATVVFTMQNARAYCEFPFPTDAVGCPAVPAKAGVIASAHSDEPDVIGFLFTISAKLADGTRTSRIRSVDKWTSQWYTSTVVWFGEQPTDFSEVTVKVQVIRVSDASVTADSPDLVYSTNGGR